MRGRADKLPYDRAPFNQSLLFNIVPVGLDRLVRRRLDKTELEFGLLMFLLVVPYVWFMVRTVFVFVQ